MLVTPDKIRLVIMTINRSPEYIHKTLASLLLSDPLVHKLRGIHLVVGGANVEYLNQYKHHKIIKIHPMSLEESKHISDWIVRKKFCHNYHRCLTIIAEDYSGLCIFEDDIMFQDRFVEKMMAAVNEMENEHKLDKYLLDLYLPYGFSPDVSFGSGKLCAKYYPQNFYGTQGIYYPRSIVPEIAQLIYNEGVVDYQKPGDMLIAQYAIATNLLYGTKRSLVQHTGFHSTGLATMFHRSPSFLEFDSAHCEQESGKSDIIQFNFRESVGGAIKFLGYGAQYKGLELVFDISSKVPEILTGDLFQLCQILHLMIENAIQYTFKGEIIVSIEVNSVTDCDVLLQFTISDTGDGTQRLMCEKLQDEEFIISETDRAMQNLALCINFVEKIGGEMWVEDDEKFVSQSGGCVFQFTVPFTRHTDITNNNVIMPINELYERSVLVVDNNHANIKMLSDMLSSWGIQPIIADSGKKALKLLNEKNNANNSVWMVLLDAHMPDMDGFMVAKQINANADLTKATLMMLTEEIKGDKEALCLEADVHNHINKPILYSELLEAMLYFTTI